MEPERAISELRKIVGKAFANSGLKQEDFAARLGVQRTLISNIVNHRASVSPQLAAKLVREFPEDAPKERVYELLATAKGLSMDPALTSKEPKPKTIEEGFAPIVGKAACGDWIEAIVEDRTPSGEKRVEEIPRWHKVKDKRAFWVEAAGDSMVGTGIDPGALLLVEPKIPLQSGNHALVYWHDQVTVKIWRETGESWLLMPTNPNYEPIVVPKAEFDKGGGRAFRITMIKTARDL